MDIKFTENKRSTDPLSELAETIKESKEAKKITKTMKKLTVKEKEMYLLLDEMTDELEEANVDVSYFPLEATSILIKYSKIILNNKL